MTESDKLFAGSVPAIYERYMVPLIFEPYAADMLGRVRALAPARLLEVAAGTGALTRALAAGLPEGTAIVATDLNPGMLERAAATGTARPVEWRQADALALPFADSAFDAVVCQFGAMFFPDRPRGFAEMRRVLRPGGALLISVWDRIEVNELADAVTEGVAREFPDDPPRFLARTPHGYHQREAIERDLRAGGFAAPRLETVAARSRAASPQDPAVAFCHGCPLRGEIESRDPHGLDRATRSAARAVAERFGEGPIDAAMSAHVVLAAR